MCQHIKGQSGRLSRINKRLGSELDSIKVKYTDLTTAEIDEINFQHISHFWQNYAIQQGKGIGGGALALGSMSIYNGKLTFKVNEAKSGKETLQSPVPAGWQPYTVALPLAPELP